MARKVRNCFLALAIAVIFTATLSLPAQAAAKDYVVGKSNFHENGKYGADGFFGPWWEDGCLSFESGALVFDTSVDNAWMTLNFTDDTLDSSQYKYMVVKIKTNDPKQSENFAMTIGKKAGKSGRKANCGQTYTEWTLADGSHPKPLTTQYTTIVVDLAKSGVISFEGDPDFALNKGDAKNSKIYISDLYLTNTNPGGSGGTTTKPGTTSKPTTQSSAPAASSPASSLDVSSADVSGTVSSEVTVSEPAESAVSTAQTVGTVASQPENTSGPFNPAVIYIILAVLIAGGTVAAILVISKKSKK